MGQIEIDQVDVVRNVRLWIARWRRERFWMNAWHYKFAEQSIERWGELLGGDL